jgi:hypothetical protein
LGWLVGDGRGGVHVVCGGKARTYAEYARHESFGGFGGDLLWGLDIGPVVGWWWHIESEDVIV